ncbi:hypothetical protein CBS101457_004244 [Exobasidium rhododendri]|nr:hypothetical protein CBS101457_004244 [Exobasidium rhododendri]
MRTFFLCSVLLATLSLSINQVQGQEVGDPVTYTEGRVIYTAVLDPDLDTVSPVAVSTTLIAATTTARVITTAAVVATTALTVCHWSITTYEAMLASRPFREKARCDSCKLPKENRSGTFCGAAFEETRFQKFYLLGAPQHGQFKQMGGAAAGGGAGTLTTQTGLQSISGYVAPVATVAPSPTNYGSGTILSPSEIPGYSGALNTGGVSSDGIKLNVAKVVVGSIAGAVIFALM